MKYIFTLFLVFYLLLKPVFSLLDYAVNYKYISTELCVNKAKPMLDCKGKCYLSKELAKSAQEDSLPLSKSKYQTQKMLDFYLPVEISEITICTLKFAASIFCKDKNEYLYSFLKPIFRPPII